MEQFLRTELLLGEKAMKKLANSKVAVFGVGGVGSFTVEALARSGVGAFLLVDNDTVSVSNINRQLVASLKTVGQYKVDVAKERILDINPEAKVSVCKGFYTPQNSSDFDLSDCDYIVDAIDTVVGKIELVINAKKNNVPIICSMGAGNKLNPCLFEVADISKTSVCPLAKVMRQELRKRKIKNVKVVFSKEEPVKISGDLSSWCSKDCIEAFQKETVKNPKKRIPGSTAFIPSVVGLIIASEVVKDLTSET